MRKVMGERAYRGAGHLVRAPLYIAKAPVRVVRYVTPKKQWLTVMGSGLARTSSAVYRRSSRRSSRRPRKDTTETEIGAGLGEESEGKSAMCVA